MTAFLFLVSIFSVLVLFVYALIGFGFITYLILKRLSVFKQFISMFSAFMPFVNKQ